MKNLIKYFSILIVFLSLISINVDAKSKTIYIDLNNLEYSTDKKDYQSITEYKALDEFLEDYNSV